MAYLGNTPTTQNFVSGTDYFNGTGSQTAFTLSRTVNSINDIQAVVNNVVQQPNDAYTLSGTTITFTSAPSSGTNNVYVRYLSTTTQTITPSSGINLSAAIGTAGAPSYSFIGDSNTGIFSPAADTVALGTNGTERMRITSTGNVGINNTPTFGLGSGLEVAPIDNGYVALSLKKGSAGAGHALDFVDSSDTLQFRIGTNFASAGNNLIFAYGTTPTAGMLLNTSGNLLVGATSTVDSERVNVTQSGQFPTIYSNNTNATNAYGIRSNLSTYFFNTTSFLYDGIEFGNLRFRVYSNGGIANLSGNDVNISDQREKKDIALAPNYLDKICQIPVKTFLYINQTDTQKTLGVIAQDVQAIAPELVEETDWSENGDGSKMRLSIYQTDLQFALMKAIQELKAELDATKAEVQALKGAA